MKLLYCSKCMDMIPLHYYVQACRCGAAVGCYYGGADETLWEIAAVQIKGDTAQVVVIPNFYLAKAAIKSRNNTWEGDLAAEVQGWVLNEKAESLVRVAKDEELEPFQLKETTEKFVLKDKEVHDRWEEQFLVKAGKLKK